MYVQYLISKFVKKLHIPAIKKSKIDKTAKVCSGSHLVNVKMRKYSYIGNFCTVINTEIGSFCSIADNCIIGGASHPMVWVSTSPVFHEGRNILKKNFSRHDIQLWKETKIGNDVWLGNNCLVKSGITIGDGAIIGMGSVVTKDVKPYAIVAGNPAVFIKNRFDEKTVLALENIRWWDLSDKEISNLSSNFNNPDELVKCFNDLRKQRHK